MKVPGIEEMFETFSECSGWLSTYPARDEIRAGLLAVFETHVKGMLAGAHLDGQASVGFDPNFYAEHILSQVKEHSSRQRTQRHD